MAAISNLGSAGTLHVTADNTLLPFGESAGVGRTGKEFFGRQSISSLTTIGGIYRLAATRSE